MTVNEAIELLSVLWERHAHIDRYDIDKKYMWTDGNYVEALDMAIKTLEKEPCEDWYDVPSDEMTLGQARRAVKDLRKKLSEQIEQEPKTGRWIFDEILDRNYYCSECKSMGVDYWDYCPYCGCRMVEPQESEDKE